MIWVLINIYHDDGLLPFFLQYYRERGVDKFGIILHTKMPLGLVPLSRYEDICIEETAEPYASGPRDNEWILWFRDRHLTANDWYIPADLDEFYWCPGLSNFKDFIGSWDYIPAKFYDRLSLDGRIHDVLPNVPLDDQFPLGGSIVKLVNGGCEDKVAMARRGINVNSGHHYAPGLPSSFSLSCHHFKFCGAHFWSWMNYREALVNYGASKEVTPFRKRYKIEDRINVFDKSLGITKSPRIGV
jgi:hypothetical protein